jgi:uncharacterized protein YfiM (DUF2279 family)
MTRLVLIFLLGWISFHTLAQPYDSVINKTRFKTFVIGSSVAYAGTLVGLSQLWYQDAKQQPFQFFNDNGEWKQVDKLGHFYASFYFSHGTSKALQWTGVSKKKSDFWGAVTGFAVLVPIEVLDGFSDAYGASTGDLVADAAGAAFYLGQSMWWNEIRIQPKFSFQRTRYAGLRPTVLGNDISSEILKDYNGQTYWLSVDVDKFIRFPRWLNIAAGYGATGMVYARDGANREAGYDAYRQYYLGFDIDLTAIRTRSKAVRTAIFLLNMIKLPAPAVEFSEKGTRFHWLAF